MTIQLLVFSSDPQITNLCGQLESSEFNVISKSNGVSLLEEVESNNIDIVVLDARSAGNSSTETLLRIREMAPLVQIIIVAAPADIRTAVNGMKSGAYDYLIKPVDTNSLVTKILGAFKLKNDQDERIRKAEMATDLTSE